MQKYMKKFFFFLDIQGGSIIPIVCCPADTNKLTSTEYFHNPSSLTDVKNDFLTFTLQLPHDKTVSDGLYSFITQGEITRLNIGSLLIRLFFFYPITFFFRYYYIYYVIIKLIEYIKLDIFGAAVYNYNKNLCTIYTV